ncbi:MAG: hypothetical protein K0V04_01185 [Deltaproteobacteria bacterium]|nr:hypothetical protein [Deltaproteobacteria bacterium]
MTSWNRLSTGLFIGGMSSLLATGCLSDDPNMDGVSSMDSGTTTADTGNGPGNATAATDNPATGVDSTAGETENGPSATTEADEVTIYDIQMGNVAEGTFVTLNDVVVVSPVAVQESKDGGLSGAVIVQDPMGGQFSAIYLFLFEEVVTGVTLQPGDTVTITGEYTEFFDFSEITVGSTDAISIGGPGTIPDPIAVSTADIVAGAADAESYESVPVCVTDATATDATNNFGDFHIDDGMAVANFFLFGTDDFLDVLPGTTFANLCGPVLYNFKEYKIAPREAADYDATLVDCQDAAPTVSIYDIQMGMVAEGDLVQIEDVVVTTPVNFAGEGFNVQDPMGGEFSGISVFMPNPDGFVPSPGDVVTLCGEYGEFFDQSQLNVAGGDATASGNGPVPAAEVVGSATISGGMTAEAYEGVLVEIEDAVVSTEANNFGEWEVDGSLLMDDSFFAIADWPTPAVGTVYTTLTGVLSYSFGNYKLAPRSPADIVPE